MPARMRKFLSKSSLPIFLSLFSRSLSLFNIYFITPVLKFFSGPFSIVIMTLLQLALGAVLGADISIKISKEQVYNDFNYATFQLIWSLLNPFTKYFFYSVVLLSVVKSLIEVILSILDKKEKARQRQENRSLPEKSVISHYHSVIIPKIQAISEEYRNSRDKNELKSALLELMSILRSFTAIWDAQDLERYRCNLMFYFPKSDLISEMLAVNWNTISCFFDAQNAVGAAEQISGILAVIASVNDSEHMYLGEEIKGTRLLLPINRSDDMHGSMQTIPGAPDAFTSGNYQYLPDILLNISEWLNKEQWHYFSHMQKERIFSYYLADKNNRSLISLPCKVPFSILLDADVNNEEIYAENEVVAILNVYSLDKKIIGGAPDLFYQFCRPILSEMAKTCCSYEMLNAKI